MDPLTAAQEIGSAGVKIGIGLANYAAGDKLEKAFQRGKEAETAANRATTQAEGASSKLDIYLQESENAIALNAQATKKGAVGFGSKAEEKADDADYATQARLIKLNLDLANAKAGSEQRRLQGRLQLVGDLVGAVSGIDASKLGSRSHPDPVIGSSQALYPNPLNPR